MYIFHFSTFCTSKTEKYINILAVLVCFFLNKLFTFNLPELFIFIHQLHLFPLSFHSKIFKNLPSIFNNPFISYSLLFTSIFFNFFSCTKKNYITQSRYPQIFPSL